MPSPIEKDEGRDKRNMRIRKIEKDKKQYLPLLLLGDEQEEMIDRYLDRGVLYVLEEEGAGDVAECVVTDEGDGILEIKNIAVAPAFQGKGYGRKLIDFLVGTYYGKYSVLQAGTGDSPLTVPFYESCGFRRSHVVKHFFLDHYDHPIYEGGVQLVDMVYFRRPLSGDRSRGAAEDKSTLSARFNGQS